MDTRRHRLLPGVTIALALALVATACGSDGSEDGAATATSQASETTTTAEPADNTEADEPTTTAEPDDAPDAEPADETSAEPEDEQADEPDSSEELFPDVIDATATLEADGTWTVNATLSSPYDTPERYADAWRVVGPDGTEYGIRVLTHDHANEQPFTRSESGISIPDDVTTVTIEGRDQISGWGGASFELALNR